MTDKDLHDVKNILRRLEIMAGLLNKRDFSAFSEEEIRRDLSADIAKLSELFGKTE